MKILGINITDYNLDFYRKKTYSKKGKKYKIGLQNYKHKVAFEISNIGLWDYNPKTKKAYYSKESLHIIGFKQNELKNVSKEWNDRVHPEDKAAYDGDFKLHLSGQLEIYEIEYRILCKNGAYKWILDKGKVIENDTNGKPTRIIGTHTDITIRKTNESKLQNNLQLITSQNKRLHNFTHIVSHNLKTHIGNLKNILEFYDASESEKERKDLVNHLKSISESLTTTIVDLDDIISIKSKSNSNQLNERVNLFNCTNKITESLDIDIKSKNITIYNGLRMDDALITNKAYLESIIYNLISNGIKYSDPNKKSQILIQSVHTKETIKILIADNGIGIDTAKFKNQLFEMYQTFHGTKREDSRGIGLYITKTQVEALNGTIELDSELHKGSTFTLTFKKKKALN
jgi:PAS domain S-box-containing protein